MTPPPVAHRPDPDLLARLLAFELDDPTADVPLSRRVARDTGLGPDATRRVILEYKRFVYLALTCEGGASPSELVDAVWHAHLLYTRSYWGPFTAMLGRPLHHEPSRGGDDERRRHDVWYARTLAAYLRVFGESPPSAFWPSRTGLRRGLSVPLGGRARAARNLLLRVVDLVGSATRASTARSRVAGLALVGMFALLGCGDSLGPYDLPGGPFLALYVTAVVAAFLVGALVDGSRGEPSAVDAPNVDDRYELAMLAGGPQRVRDAALIALVSKGHVEVAVERRHITFRRRETAAAEHLPPLEHATLARLPESDPAKLTNISLRDEPLIMAVREALTQRGLLRTSSELARIGRRRAIPLIAVGLFGVGKIVVGTAREKPVVFLLVLVLITFVTALIRSVSASPRTARGDAVFRVSERAAHRSFATLSADPITVPAALTLGVAVEGFAHHALALHGATRALHGVGRPTTNDGCGGGCGGAGGGCGGGGDGGCGGCGGD